MELCKRRELSDIIGKHRMPFGKHLIHNMTTAYGMNQMFSDICRLRPKFTEFYKAGQQIRSKIDSFQNANFFISQPNPMMLPLI